MRGGVAGFKNIAYLCIAIQRNSTYKQNGSVVQLVRIHACHAWGRGFESRPDRQRKGLDNVNYQDLFSFYTQSHFLFWINSVSRITYKSRVLEISGVEEAIPELATFGLGA